jgi:hypothetical protein
MPNWMLIHGILLVIWGCVFLFVYYVKSWTLSAPFNRITSMKIVFYYLLPLSWLASSIFLGIILYYSGRLKNTDILFLILLPFVVLMIYGFYQWFSNQSYNKHKEQIHKSLGDFKDSCNEWTKQFSFIKDENIDLEIYISKGKPVGRMIVFGLDSENETILKKQQENVPPGLTIMVSKKKWIPSSLSSNFLFDN